MEDYGTQTEPQETCLCLWNFYEIGKYFLPRTKTFPSGNSLLGLRFQSSFNMQYVLIQKTLLLWSRLSFHQIFYQLFLPASISSIPGQEEEKSAGKHNSSRNRNNSRINYKKTANHLIINTPSLLLLYCSIFDLQASFEKHKNYEKSLWKSFFLLLGRSFSLLHRSMREQWKDKLKIFQSQA